MDQSGPSQATAAAAHAAAANLIIVLLFVLQGAFPHLSVPATVAVALTPLLSVLVHWAIVRFGLSQYAVDEMQAHAPEPEPLPIAPPAPLPEAPKVS